MKDLKKAVNEYYSQIKDIKGLHGVTALLSWDQETEMPENGIEERANQTALMEKLVHQRSTSKNFVKLVNDLYEAKEELSTIDKRSVEVSKKELDKNIKLPDSFVEETAALTSKAQNAWVSAKKNEDYSAFAPFLTAIYENKRKYAEYIDSTKPVYDVLLDDFDEGMTTETVAGVFKDLRAELVKILPKIKKNELKGVFTSSNFNKHTTKELLKELTTKIGFDYKSGVLGEVHHPFETKIGNKDVRINVKYPENDLSFSVTSAIHELGHGLYEQNVDPEYFHTAFDSGSSLPIHESQSRALENMIGRSESFWKFAMPIVYKYYPELKKFDYQDAVNDLNVVAPSFIRTEADEVTYNLHIILRFEIEQLILNKEISTEDIPEVWNNKMKDLLGIVPDKLSLGCLQDVHWSMGAIGYFPTYALGNLVAGQFWKKFTAENAGFEKAIEQGDFSSYYNWSKQNIWKHGSFYTSKEFIKNITGEDLSYKYFINYLETKYIKN